MKKILFIFLFPLVMLSCYKSVSDARQVKVGMSGNELKYIMGEPTEIKVYPGREVWSFDYCDGNNTLERMEIVIANDKIITFTTY